MAVHSQVTNPTCIQYFSNFNHNPHPQPHPLTHFLCSSNPITHPRYPTHPHYPSLLGLRQGPVPAALLGILSRGPTTRDRGCPRGSLRRAGYIHTYILYNNILLFKTQTIYNDLYALSTSYIIPNQHTLPILILSFLHILSSHPTPLFTRPSFTSHPSLSPPLFTTPLHPLVTPSRPLPPPLYPLPGDRAREADSALWVLSEVSAVEDAWAYATRHTALQQQLLRVTTGSANHNHNHNSNNSNHNHHHQNLAHSISNILPATVSGVCTGPGPGPRPSTTTLHTFASFLKTLLIEDVRSLAEPQLRVLFKTLFQCACDVTEEPPVNGNGSGSGSSGSNTTSGSGNSNSNSSNGNSRSNDKENNHTNKNHQNNKNNSRNEDRGSSGSGLSYQMLLDRSNQHHGRILHDALLIIVDNSLLLIILAQCVLFIFPCSTTTTNTSSIV